MEKILDVLEIHFEKKKNKTKNIKKITVSKIHFNQSIPLFATFHILKS